MSTTRMCKAPEMRSQISSYRIKLKLDDRLTPDSGKIWGSDRGLRVLSKRGKCLLAGMKLREGGWLRYVVKFLCQHDDL